MKFVKKFEEFKFNNPKIAPNKPQTPTKPIEPILPIKPEEDEDEDEYTIERPSIDPDPMAKKKEKEQLNKVVKKFQVENKKSKAK